MDTSVLLASGFDRSGYAFVVEDGVKQVEEDRIDTDSHSDDTPFSDDTNGKGDSQVDDAAPHDDVYGETHAHFDDDHGTYEDDHSDRGDESGRDGDSDRKGNSDGEGEEADRAGDAESLSAKKNVCILKAMTSLLAARKDQAMNLSVFLEDSLLPNAFPIQAPSLKLKGYPAQNPYDRLLQPLQCSTVLCTGQGSSQSLHRSCS